MTTKTKAKTKKKTTSHKRAQEMLSAFIKDQRAKAKYDARMKECKAYLATYAEENPDNFDNKGNLQLNGGYLHIANETKVVSCDQFDLVKFVKDYPELLDAKFKTSAVKAILKSAEGVEKLTTNHCVELSETQKLEIVVQ